MQLLDYRLALEKLDVFCVRHDDKYTSVTMQVDKNRFHITVTPEHFL